MSYSLAAAFDSAESIDDRLRTGSRFARSSTSTRGPHYRDRTAFCTTNRWARHTVMGGANTNLEKCGATIATWMPHVTVEAGKHIRFSPARTRRSVVHGTALHTGFRSIHWFTSQCDSLKTHVLLATRISEGGHLSRRHRRRQKLLVARNQVM